MHFDTEKFSDNLRAAGINQNVIDALVDQFSHDRSSSLLTKDDLRHFEDRLVLRFGVLLFVGSFVAVTAWFHL